MNRHLLSRLLSVPVLAITCVIPGVFAQEDELQAINRSVLETHIMPGYAAFAGAAGTLANEAEALCPMPDASRLTAIREAWHDTMDAWQRVQHIRFGPVTYFNWQYRLQFWPDERGVIGRQLDALIRAGDPAMLEADELASQSVGVQGLPALEMLLFDAGSQTDLQTPFRCQLVQAIAANIDGISAQMLQRWQDEFSATLMLEDDSGWFMDHSDATTELLKALVETVPLIRERKLMLPMGEAEGRFRVQRAESWRSQRSIRNIRLNVAALRELFDGVREEPGVGQVFPAGHRNDIAGHFDSVQNRLDAMPAGFQAWMEDDTAGREGLQALLDDLDNLYEAMEAGVKDTDLYLGFNSLDGD